MLVATPLRSATMHECLVPQVDLVGCSGASDAAHPANPKAEKQTQQGWHPHGHHVARGARQQSTSSFQALAGVRVVACLLGHSDKKKQRALCSCAQTQLDHMGCPPCMIQGVDHTHSNTPEPGMGGNSRKKDPRP